MSTATAPATAALPKLEDLDPPEGTAAGNGSAEPEAKADEPPKRKRNRNPGPDAKPRGVAGQTANLERQLREQFQAIGFMVQLIEPYDGQVILQNADRLAAAYARLAAVNPMVRRMLTGAGNGQAYLGAIVATAAVALPILAHHGMLPTGPLAAMFGQPEPEPATDAAS
jgi:hypothetical protein